MKAIARTKVPDSERLDWLEARSGSSGIHDEDEAQRILDAAKQPAAPANTQSMEELASRLRLTPPRGLVEDVPDYGATDDRDTIAVWSTTEGMSNEA